MSEPTIDLSASIADYFGGMVRDAIRERRVDASAAATEYLVSLLASYAAPAPAPSFERPLTLELEDAELAVGPDRFERLRSLGDRVLWALGFCGEHIEHRGVSRSYVEGIGSDAYSRAAAMIRARGPSGIDVLRELSSGFRSFAGVLADVAEGAFAKQARRDGGIVRLYERFLRTGSSRIGAELSALGVVPLRRVGLA